jgi:fatty-acyl-CoA synthase
MDTFKTGMLVGNIVREVAAERPGALAGTLGEEAIAFGALDSAADRLAAGLRGAGIGRGDVVVWWSGPSLDSLMTMTACARVSAVFAPLSPLLGEAEVRAVIDYMRPALVVAAPETVERAVALGAPLAVLRPPAPTGAVDLAALSRAAEGVAPGLADLDDSDPHILYLTSGSTGRPKGVLVSHRASWIRSRRGGGSYGDDLDGVLCSFPLYHYGGWHYVLEAWLNGTAVHLVRKADGRHLRAALERRRPNAIYCIPAVWERLLAEPADLGGVRYADTGTSAVGDGLFARLAERLPGARTTVLYGASEAGRMTALRAEDLAAHPESVGRPVEPGRVRIAEDGEILFAGPTLMNGYLDLPDESAAAIADGWYRTGDLGTQDEEGYVRITGRKREVIRSGGETISPAEVETAIGALPGVAELAVVGLPDPRWGEVVCAAVVLAPAGTPPSVEDLRARLSTLAPHKHPRLVAVVDSIPRTTATGQVRRAPLRDSVLTGRKLDT